MDACKSVHALNSANRTESFLRQAPFFGGGGGAAVVFLFLVSGNCWLNPMLLLKQFWRNKTV